MMISILQLEEILVNPGYIDKEVFQEALKKNEDNFKKVCDYLINKDYIKDEELGLLIAQFLGYSFISLKKEKIDQKVLNKVSENTAKKFEFIPYYEDDNYLKAGIRHPEDLEAIHNLERILGKKIIASYITERDFKSALVFYKKDIATKLKELINELEKEKKEGGLSQVNKVIVNTILEYAYFSKASDLHIEPNKDAIIIRFRIDGVLHEVASIPKKYLEAILTRIKILSKLRTDEHFSAQDGGFQYLVGDETIDLRVSIVPVSSGGKVVMRLLASGNRQKKLSNLGFSESDLEKINKSLKSPHGMILITGPTGSGKTTTIYEILKTLNTEEVNISTIEDPVEYDIERINQIQVNEKTNLSFASGLRAIVRQDPDIIMVGEIRDKETAEIAVNSAMTGHLVLSTLHANDAATTFPRLIDMNVEEFLISSTVNIIIAQRLVRRLCEKCRVSYTIDEKEYNLIKSDESVLRAIEKIVNKRIEDVTFFRSAGCKTCTGTGYVGRVGVFEVLEVSDEIRSLINKKASSDEIKKQAREEGMQTMMEDGIKKVVNGVTSIEEVMKVARD